MSPASFARPLAAAVLVALGLGPGVEDVAAGTAVAPFEVRAQLVFRADGCAGFGDPVTLACGSPSTPVVLQPRPALTGLMLEDGWITYGRSTEVYDSVYAASLTTRVIRYEQWEYIETLVSW